MNKIANVTLTGGIIGFLAGSPKNRLNNVIQKENANGWRVVQIIPAESGNYFLILLRLIILLLTIFLYTPANGYYIVLESTKHEEKQTSTNTQSANANFKTCSKCGNQVDENDTFCQSCGNKLK